MNILNNNFDVEEVFDTSFTIPDCFVAQPNKLGGGHGEAKLYIASKDKMGEFFGGSGFTAKCFLLKSDLIAYMNAIKGEYKHPSFEYSGKAKLPALWDKRVAELNTLPDIIEFNINDQTQIKGPRGYVNSSDDGYSLIRELCLPLISYISAMRLKDTQGGIIFYWKLFADYEAIANKKEALVFTYGKEKVLETPAEKRADKKEAELRYARLGQGKYREQMLEECPFCPITMINDERLLIASHAKPWVVSTDKEKVDPKNGLILSPLFDKLFDKGFITFTDDKYMKLSNWITPQNYKRMGLKDNTYIQMLPLDEERCKYLAYHRESVFKG